MIAVIGLWVCIGLVALAILAIIISGVRGLINGNVNGMKVGTMLLPVVIWAIVLLISGSWMKAGIATLLIMIALTIVAIVITGIKGVFT